MTSSSAAGERCPPSTSPTGRGRPGRPRDPATDRAILDAAHALIYELGPAGVTFDAIARRAGVSRATLYRRYSSLAQIVLEIERGHAAPTMVPDTGGVRGDLEALAFASYESLSATVHGRFHAHLISQQAVDAELADLVRRLWNQRRAATRVVLERAVDRGEVRPDADLDVALDLLAGLLYFRLFVRSEDAEPAELRRAVDTVLEGITPRS